MDCPSEISCTIGEEPSHATALLDAVTPVSPVIVYDCFNFVGIS